MISFLPCPSAVPCGTWCISCTSNHIRRMWLRGCAGSITHGLISHSWSNINHRTGWARQCPITNAKSHQRLASLDLRTRSEIAANGRLHKKRLASQVLRAHISHISEWRARTCGPDLRLQQAADYIRSDLRARSCGLTSVTSANNEPGPADQIRDCSKRQTTQRGFAVKDLYYNNILFVRRRKQ